MSDAAPRRWRSWSKCLAAGLIAGRLALRVNNCGTDREPDGPAEGEERVAAVERGAGVALTAFGDAERPADDDALVARLRRVIDARGEAPEDADAAASVGLHGPAAGTVERGPREPQRGQLRCDEPRRDDTAVPERNWAKPKSVAARPADEAAGERVVGVVAARVRQSLRLREADRRRSFEVEDARPSLGDELPAVEDADGIPLPLDRHLHVERRRLPQRHLDDIGIDELRERPARVAAVRRRFRSAKTPRDHDDLRQELPGLDSNQQPFG